MIKSMTFKDANRNEIAVKFSSEGTSDGKNDKEMSTI